MAETDTANDAKNAGQESKAATAEPVAKPEATAAPGAATPAAAPKPEARPEPPAPVDEHIARPQGDLVLTVKVKKLLFFGVRGQEVKVLQADKLIDRIVTDSRGQALFKLPAGEYTVTSADKQVPIQLRKHATLRL